MATYTKFEQEYLVGAYLLVERTGREIVQAREILTTFNIEPKQNWVRRAIQSYTDYGYSRGRMSMGDELDQHIYLSPEGIKEAERLVDEGIVSVADLEKQPATPTPLHGALLTEIVEAEVVPASDRLVRLDHNSEAYEEVVAKTEALSVALATGNDVGEMTTEAVAVAAAEVDSIGRELRGEAIRVPAFWDRAKSLLGWIGRVAADAAVGAIALAVLAALGTLLGFQVPF